MERNTQNRTIDRQPHPEAAFGPSEWVWAHGDGRRANDWAQFRTRLSWDGSANVDLTLTADSRYRLRVNGRWVGDGPVRGWPEHYYYDVRSLSDFLQPGENEIRVWVQHYGGSSFHLIPQTGAFRAALRVGGDLISWTGGPEWQVAAVPQQPAATPRISVQMPPFEIVDARQPAEPEWFTPVSLSAPPWTLERVRDVVEPKVEAVPVPGSPECRKLAATPETMAVLLNQLLHPGRVREAVQRNHGCGLAAVARVSEAQTFHWYAEDWDLYIDGECLKGNEWSATEGTHRVLAFYRKVFDNRVDSAFGPPGEGMEWHHPLRPEETASPWVFLPLKEFGMDAGDLHWLDHRARDLEEWQERYQSRCAELGGATGDAARFEEVVRSQGRDLPAESLLVPDPTAEFIRRQPLEPHPLTSSEDDTCSFRMPEDGGEVELAFDLGDQKCGFLGFEVEASAGTRIDGHLVEHVRQDGVIQHTHENRNGFRFIVSGEGREAFFSMQRRSGRHLFLRFHGGKGEVRFRGLMLYESRYPAECPHPFRCSEDLLTRIWQAADRTMQLSMDDVFIDSLYEQTLWVGDARNEQLYGLTAYDARDISRRSARLAADSLDRSVMVNSQVPSCWETIIPIWSFLWVISIREYVEYSGETDALLEFWPAIRKNLHAAAAQLNEQALFEAPWWNLFEWAHVDGAHRIVLHNTLFFLGAVEAALQCEAWIGDPDERDWLESLQRRLGDAVRRQRDPESGLYPESIHRDGTVSRKFSIHTQFLAVLFGVARGDEADEMLERVAGNQGELVELASPFALQFYCEAFERRGRTGHVLDAMRTCFAPMVEIGTTLWEALPGSATSPEGFPTRSHCHGWSSCAMDFLPRIVLGLRMAELGSRSICCSPRPHGLSWAEGCRMTPSGPVEVRWKVEGNRCVVHLIHPEDVRVCFETNPVLDAAGLALEATHEVRSES